MLITRLTSRASRLATASVFAFAVSACGGQNETSTSPDPSPSLKAPALPAALPNRFADVEYPDAVGHEWSGPEEIYEKVCAYCHAPKPFGGVGPILLGRQLPAQYTIYTVRNGRNGMPGFSVTEFTDAELEAVANLIQNSEAEPAQPGVNMP